MKPSSTLIIATAITASFITANAQTQGQVYRRDTSIKVYDGGMHEKMMAWCGGFDSPQFAMGDLNKDGKNDMVIYERYKGIRTFLNMGVAGNPKYVYAPQYELNFPAIDGFMTLVDYNHDGIPDLVSGGGNFFIWKGFYNSANQLSFTFYKGLEYNNDSFSSGSNNAYVSPTDIPAVVDVDNDGDLDFIAFNSLGGNFVYWYKNVQVEDTLPSDSIRIKLRDQCWGKFYQTARLYHQLNWNCSNANLGLNAREMRKTHSGNAICLIDMDGDGDYDYLDGSVGYDNVAYLENGRIPYGVHDHDSMVYQDTTWLKTGKIITLPIWPALFNVNIDGDGKKDLMIAPNSAAENYKCTIYMKNTGTASVPVFTYQNDTFFTSQTIDVGTNAYPFFFDYNKDGKPDLFIGSRGYYTSGGTYKAQIAYYLNTSVPGAPSFTLQTSDFMGLSAHNYAGAAPAIGDIDNDGKADLVIGHYDGTMSYFTNIAGSDSVQPQWQLVQATLKDAAGHTVYTAGSATPFIYDLDKDGKPDLLSGSFSGYVYYYQNTATTPGNISLKYITNKVGNARADNDIYGPGTSTVFIGKIDNSNVDYMMLGSSSGMLYRYDGFQSGNTTVPYTRLDSNYSYIDTAYALLNRHGNYYGLQSAPAIADVDGDGKYEMVVGLTYGGLMLYKQDTNVYVSACSCTPVSSDAHVYPNPATNTLNIEWTASFGTDAVHISLISVTGQRVLEKTVSAQMLHAQLNTMGLNAGVYYCIIQSGSGRKAVPVTILR
ncbi:MAG: T9SS type A sorting domain-containing protein [Taibaiella sp.]|nr:T9SS type A sorting domain-containing protein [Taibaiella sp.]